MTQTPIQKILSCFLRDEDGAVTVDWVVLTAAVVLLSVLGLAAIRVALASATSDIATAISSAANAAT